MKFLFLIPAIAILLLTSFGNAQTVEFSHDKVIDTGKVLQGEMVTGNLQFTNTGTVDVEIESVKPSCGCTAVAPEKLVYAPGETATIPFTIDSKKFKGVIRKTIRINFKNVEPKTYVFVVQADVATELTITPDFINFQQVNLNPDTVLTEFFEIENESDQNIEIKNIYSSSESLKISPQSVVIPAGKSHLIQLNFTPNQAGRQNTKIHIESNHQTQSVVDLPVFINVKSSS